MTLRKLPFGLHLVGHSLILSFMMITNIFPVSSQIPYEDFIQFNSPDSVILHDIRQFSFSSSFDTKSRKRFELKFKVAKDAQMFYQMIDQQRRLIQQERPRRSPTSPPAQRSSYFVVD